MLFYSYKKKKKKKRGGGKCFSHPEWRVAKCFVLDVLTILEGGHKRFPPFDGGRGGGITVPSPPCI